MEALEPDYEDYAAVVRAFTDAVVDQRNGRVVTGVPADLERDAIETGTLDDAAIIWRLRASGLAVDALYFRRPNGLTFIVRWPCGTMKLYDVELP